MGFNEVMENEEEEDAHRSWNFKRGAIEFENTRKRSSSCQKTTEFDGIIVKRGLLKKKGMMFFNNRIVQLTTKGVLSYSDPKTPDLVKARFLLSEPGVSVKKSGKF